MKLNELRALDVGAKVNWLDPDFNECTGQYQIIEIRSDSGRIENHDSMVVLSGGIGHVAEALACELG